jgi:lysophospholipase L1-like esterase
MGRMERDGTAAANAANLAGWLVGGALLLLALRMGEGWAQRHFLPSWAYGWDVQMRILLVLRLIVAAVGLAVLFLLRPWLVRAFRAGRGRQALFTLLTSALAVVAALGVTEGVLRTKTWRSVQERWDQEPVRIREPLYGWGFLPNHAGAVRLDGRTIHYATGPYGYRAPAAGVGPDLAKPTIVFAGESLVFGYGLDWPDTIAAQVQAISGIQAANVAVNAHAVDQTYLRLRAELPRFRRPVAVVVPFMARTFDRNLDRDRPHLDAALRWHPAEPPSFRLVELARRVTRYRSADSIGQGTQMTRAALARIFALAKARGARPLLLVPQFLPESEREREVRRDVLDSAHIPYLLVPVPANERSPSHGHPDPRGARRIAEAVAAALRR